ncbi:hypothetical protein MBANPS3_008678 [Mucor bainieri]
MSVNWSAFPVEIWLSIFDRVEDIQQLVECRLVCKAWDPLAERAMFGQVLVLNNVDILTGFYNHLARKPSLGRFIKAIDFGGENFGMRNIPFLKHFFQLAFTPNIRSVQGSVDDKSLDIMFDIAQGSTEQFKELAYLPSKMLYTSNRQEMALYFRKTLKRLILVVDSRRSDYLRSIQPLLNRLDEFENLTSLIIIFYGNIDEFTICEGILRRCNHLLELTIYDISNAWVERNELKAWMVRNVTKCPNVCAMHILFANIPQSVEYLLFKYPNAHTVKLSGYGIPNAQEEEVILRCINAVNGVETVVVSWWITQFTVLQNLIDAMKSKHNTLAITTRTEYEHITALGAALVEAKRYTSTRQSNFEITISRRDQPASFVEDIISFIHADSNEWSCE